jgi:hypothetical protein
MVSMMAIDPVFSALVSLGLGTLMLAAGIHKMRNRSRFRDAVAAYALVPASLVGPVSFVLPLVEIGGAVAALSMAREIGGAGLIGIGALLVLYAAAIGVNLLRGRRDLDCGCFAVGARHARIRPAMVGRNLLLATAALLAALLPRMDRPLIWIDVLTLGAAIAVLAVLYFALEAALALPTHRESP